MAEHYTNLSPKDFEIVHKNVIQLCAVAEVLGVKEEENKVFSFFKGLK